MAKKGKRTILTDSNLGAPRHARPPVALVICDDPFADLGMLTSERCKAALPFAGKYRLIDFALSSCVNSDIETVGVITQYKPRSLQSHVAYGRAWDLDRPTGGLSFLHPYQGRRTMNWYTGSADAIHQNQDYILRQKTDEVLILIGSQVYGMDFGPMIAQHRETQAHLTVAVVQVVQSLAGQAHTLRLDSQGLVQEVVLPGTEDIKKAVKEVLE